MPNGQLSLASLNGLNGFKINGETPDSGSGSPVIGGSDINKDGFLDLFIGAFGYNDSVGRSYVVYGGSGLGSSGAIDLSNLNGSNGFKLDGEMGGDQATVQAVADINGDTFPDLLIGAINYNNTAGRSYCVFGGGGVGSGGVIKLSSLNGSNGFKMDAETGSDGINPGDEAIITAAADINGDNITDLLIGARSYNNAVGRSYVVFGKSGIGSGGLIKLSSINGTNGFKLDGESPDDMAQVYAAADINGDGFSDLLIGSSDHNNGPGRSYVVFGGPGVGSSGVIALSSLNGVNGFKIDGQAGDYAQVYSAGDVNGDGHADIFISALAKNNYQGGGYVVFGGPGVGSSGIISLSALDGSNGFKFDGETSGDVCGYPIAFAGDINCDGYGDMLIGAYGHNNYTGRTYVLFGDPEVGASGVVTLSNLDGGKGFMLDGETALSLSGIDLGAAGDVNKDGCADFMVGAHGYNNYVGRSYVFYGDTTPVFINNNLTVHVGETVTLNSTYLSAYDLKHGNDTLVFVPSTISRGQFEAVNNPGVSIVNFTQGNVTRGEVQFQHDGTLIAPSYNMMVRSSGSGLFVAGPNPAGIKFLPSNSPGGSGSTLSLKNTIIAAVVSGLIGLAFAGIKICLKRSANKKLSDILGEGTDQYDLNVVRPVAKEIASHVKVTGCMDYTTEAEMVSFKSSVRSLLTELDKRGVNLRFEQIGEAKRDGLINEIAVQTKQELTPKGCCACVVSFFNSRVTPEDIRKAAPNIAKAVASNQGFLSSRAGVEMNSLSEPTGLSM